MSSRSCRSMSSMHVLASSRLSWPLTVKHITQITRHKQQNITSTADLPLSLIWPFRKFPTTFAKHSSYHQLRSSNQYYNCYFPSSHLSSASVFFPFSKSIHPLFHAAFCCALNNHLCLHFHNILYTHDTMPPGFHRHPFRLVCLNLALKQEQNAVCQSIHLHLLCWCGGIEQHAADEDK